MQSDAPNRYRCMKRALTLSITTLLLPMMAAAASESSAPPRYRVLHSEAVSTPAAPSRYQVSGEAIQATAAARYRLLGGGADKSAGETCESGDELFAHGFEN